MKILHVCLIFHRSVASGSTKVAYDVSHELAKRGQSVTVFTSDMRDKYTKVRSRFEKKEGVSVYRFQTIGAVATRKLKILVTPNIIMKLRNDIRLYDVIHLHEYYSFQNIVVHHFAKRYGVPYILQAHGTIARIDKRFMKWLYDVVFGHRILRDASKVIALSETEVQQYRSAGVPEEGIAVVPNGIDLSGYRNLPPKGSFKKKFDMPEDKKIILCLGRIHKTKGIDFLVKAYAYLTKRMNFHNALLVIAGPDDGYLGQVKSLVRGLGLSDEVLFTSMLPEQDKAGAYVDSSIVVNVEPRNVFGLVPLEAAACSTPVIVSSGNAISEAICEGKFGFSVKYGDVFELAEIMHKMLNNDNLLKEMGQKGHKFIFENYDWSKIVPKIEKVYEEASSAAYK